MPEGGLGSRRRSNEQQCWDRYVNNDSQNDLINNPDHSQVIDDSLQRSINQ